MAFADLRDELTCSICLSIYTDPVTLTCGHSYCRVCIGDVLDTQDRSGVYTCPECRVEFQERPALEKNRKLCNIAESFLSVHPEQMQVKVFCTYCDFPFPAAKTCLHCEVSLCNKHLIKHNKSQEHVLTEPTTCLGSQKCLDNEKDLDCCSGDAASIDASCRKGGHQMEAMHEICEKNKNKLKIILEKLTLKREETEIQVQKLQEFKREVQEKAAGETGKVIAIIKDITEQLEALEKRVLSEISRQEEQVSLRVSDLTRKLEFKKEELSRKMGHIEDLGNMTDPLTVSQENELDSADYCDTEGEGDRDREIDYQNSHTEGDLDVSLISLSLHTGLVDIVTGVKRKFHSTESSDILLGVKITADIVMDINTASNHIALSSDLKTALWSEIAKSRPETPERFQDYPQVLSTRSFDSGQHYWELETSESDGWRIGMAYPSVDRKGFKSLLGYNKKSWCLWRWYNQYSVRHNSKGIHLPHSPSCQKLGISLDYEAGRLSFYELCDPIRHLHTITYTFTEPLHVALWIVNDAWVKVVPRIDEFCITAK
ncbi:E3 ubiquitin ISG15 ligase TRIM25-like [Pelobates cultripes]|uniref:E3 ubiquitin ISG15 ligase TRIM25-like n=1 Tax=Pelobates cultripes TaxID=61616 RepID=A0AAD1WS55_PELCU|nr:E3 ubiquitin ISG15 ligase TRIM25-like [Pelobates cultripes]